MSQPDRDLSWPQRLSFATPQIGVGISGTIMASWLTFFLVPPEAEIEAGRVALISGAAYIVLELWGKLVDAFADPLVGHWSDSTRSRWGRRMPFIVLGTPLMALCYLGLWFLPGEPGSWTNIAYLAVVMTAYWIVFTVVLGPYSALLPEIATTSRGRIVLSSVVGFFGAIGAIFGLSASEFISQVPDGVTWAGVHIPTGFQAAGVIGAATIFLCMVPALNIREAPHSSAKEVKTSAWQGVRDAARNPSFWPVVVIAFAFKLAGAMIVTMLPYLTTVVLERAPGVAGLVEADMGEAWQGYLMAIVLGGAILWLPFIQLIGKRLSHKAMAMLAGGMYGLGMLAMPFSGLLPDPTWGVIAIMASLSLPTSIALVMPAVLFADVIDYDETLSGLRREGIYNGAVALLTKWAEGVGRALVVGLLALGSTREDPFGIWLAAPIAGAVMLIGLWFFRRYPEAEMKAAIAALRDDPLASTPDDP